MANREKDLSAAFLSGETVIAGLTCRPFSAGTRTVAHKLGLRGFGGSEGPCADWSSERQLAAFLYIQSKPISEVIALVKKSPEIIDETILEFELSIDLTQLASIASQAGDDAKLIDATQFEIEPKPDDKPESTPPN